MKVVALKRALVKGSREGQRFGRAFGRRSRRRLHIFNQSLRIYSPLVDLDDHSLLVNQERSGNAEIAAAVEQIAVDDVVDGNHLRRREENWERERVFRREACGKSVSAIVDVDRQNV